MTITTNRITAKNPRMDPSIYLNRWACPLISTRVYWRHLLWCIIWNLFTFIYNVTLHITHIHYNDVILGAIASQITSLKIVYSIVYSDADQGKYQSSASLALLRGNHRGPVNSPHKCSVTRKKFPFDDVIMKTLFCDSRGESQFSVHRTHLTGSYV